MNQPLGDNAAMRYKRLAFYAQDVDQFNAALDAFISKSQAVCALLIDQEGHMIAKRGFLERFDSAALAALVAGSFASTKQVAALLGENEFNVQSHQGADHSIHITLVGERTLQLAMFNSSAKAGMVADGELALKINGVLTEISQRPAKRAARILAKDYRKKQRNSTIFSVACRFSSPLQRAATTNRSHDSNASNQDTPDTPQLHDNRCVALSLTQVAWYDGLMMAEFLSTHKVLLQKSSIGLEVQ